MQKIRIEVQYFNGCPNSEKSLQMVKSFINNSEIEIEFEEVLVETNETAKKYKFRGSPTILINGHDIDGLEENTTPSLSCRYYKNGLPTEENLKNFIANLKEQN